MESYRARQDMCGAKKPNARAELWSVYFKGQGTLTLNHGKKCLMLNQSGILNNERKILKFSKIYFKDALFYLYNCNVFVLFLILWYLPTFITVELLYTLYNCYLGDKINWPL